jgi:hypothetical protein
MYIAAISSGPGHSLRSRRLLRFALVMVPQGLYGSKVIKGRCDGSKQLRQLVPGTAHFLLGRAFRRLQAAVVGKTKKDARRSNGFPPPAPPREQGS